LLPNEQANLPGAARAEETDSTKKTRPVAPGQVECLVIPRVSIVRELTVAIASEKS